MKLPLIQKQDKPILGDSGNILSKEEKPTVNFSTDMSVELLENHDQDVKVKWYFICI
jgi:hypothetical protein